MHDMPVTIVRIYVELINIKQFTILSRCLKVWKPLLSDVTLSHRYSSLKILRIKKLIERMLYSQQSPERTTAGIGKSVR